MILSTENGALRSLVGERRAIEILAKAGFDAIDYTFTPWMERGEMPWNRDGYQDYAKEVVQMAKDNGVYFNQAHAPFIYLCRSGAWRPAPCWASPTWWSIRSTTCPITTGARRGRATRTSSGI